MFRNSSLRVCPSGCAPHMLSIWWRRYRTDLWFRASRQPTTPTIVNQWSDQRAHGSSIQWLYRELETRPSNMSIFKTRIYMFFWDTPPGLCSEWSQYILSICWPYTDSIQVTFIGCSLNCIQEPWHFCKPLPKLSNRVDIEYLQAPIRQGYQGKKDTCIYIGHSTDTRKKCGKYIQSIYSTYADHVQVTIIPKAKGVQSTTISVKLYGTFISHLIWLDSHLLA